MKQGIHPPYHYVVFQDMNSGFQILTRASISSKEEIKWKDGKTYPLIKKETSSDTHPFYTGKGALVVQGGHVERFMTRFGIKKKPQ